MNEAPPSLIALEGVSKVFGRGERAVRALDRVSLEVARGAFVSLVGPSGSGKSTLLHLIAGFDVASEGTIRVGEHRITTMDDDALALFRRRHVGFVFQAFNLLPGLSAEENVALPLLLDGVRKREDGPRVERMLDFVGLAHRREHRPDELSGGEMQRVAIARALVIEPGVLLADEPTGNLDSKMGAQILDRLRVAAAELGQTVVMVTHDLRAAGVGDRIVTLEDGRIAG
jgi:putative ABC transport system ATP-binding protein